MPTKNEVKKHQQDFLDKAKARTVPLTILINDIEIAVNPGVFPPATDTKLLASHISTKPGENIIDVTAGSGIISVIAGLQGACGYAVDINPLAVANARQNLLSHDITSIQALESDHFSNVLEGSFDQVFANGPFIEGTIVDPMDYACYGARSFIETLFRQVSERLSVKGKLLIVVAEWSELDHLEKVASQNNLHPKVIAQRKSDDGERNYLLYEVKRL